MASFVRPAVGARAMTLRPADEIMQLSCVPRIADHQLSDGLEAVYAVW